MSADKIYFVYTLMERIAAEIKAEIALEVKTLLNKEEKGLIWLLFWLCFDGGSETYVQMK